jgi:hypothetical protein
VHTIATIHAAIAVISDSVAIRRWRASRIALVIALCVIGRPNRWNLFHLFSFALAKASYLQGGS